jgi:hypothetical protein
MAIADVGMGAQRALRQMVQDRLERERQEHGMRMAEGTQRFQGKQLDLQQQNLNLQAEEYKRKGERYLAGVPGQEAATALAVARAQALSPEALERASQQSLAEIAAKGRESQNLATLRGQLKGELADEQAAHKRRQEAINFQRARDLRREMQNLSPELKNLFDTIFEKQVEAQKPWIGNLTTEQMVDIGINAIEQVRQRGQIPIPVGDQSNLEAAMLGKPPAGIRTGQPGSPTEPLPPPGRAMDPEFVGGAMGEATPPQQPDRPLSPEALKRALEFIERR